MPKNWFLSKILSLYTSSVITLSFDAVLIAGFGKVSLSWTSPVRLNLDGKKAFVQLNQNYRKNIGQVVPFKGNREMSCFYAPMPRHLQKLQNSQWT